MRIVLLLLSVLFLMIVCVSCGKGTSTGDAGSTAVAVTIGGDGTSARIETESHPYLAAAKTLLAELLSTSKAEAAIPANVTDVTITISTQDPSAPMATLTRTVHVAGQSAITERFLVPNGRSRSIKVESRDAVGNLQYQGSKVVDLHGAEVSIAILMEDAAPPTFAGLATATAVSTTEIELAWSAATDNVTPADAMVYEIYVSTSPGMENLAAASFTTAPKATSFRVPGLNPNTAYYFVVRAVDQQRLRDDNRVERSATTLIPVETVPPVFEGVLLGAAGSVDAATLGDILLLWRPATDNASAPGGIVYLIYESTTPGGQSFTVPSFTTVPGATSLRITTLPLGSHYFVVRARDTAGNTDSNTTEVAVTTATLFATLGFDPPLSATALVIDPGGTVLTPGNSPLTTATFTVRNAAGTVLATSVNVSLDPGGVARTSWAPGIVVDAVSVTATVNPALSLTVPVP